MTGAIPVSGQSDRRVGLWDQQGIRKTYKYKLQPTAEQERVLDRTVMLCRTLYNAALEQRTTWWERGQGIGATYFQQQAELPDLKAACPEFGEVHAHVLQDVILRLERTFQAFFRRVKAGEQPGYPRFRGKGRYTSFTFPEYGNGAVLDGGLLSLSKIGRIAIRLHRPPEGTPKTVTVSRE
ncbi:MAG TPA: transposase, partial [Ktedonobacterales bacterium]